MNWNNGAVQSRTTTARPKKDRRSGKKGMLEQARNTRIEFPATISVSSALDILNSGSYSLD